MQICSWKTVSWLNLKAVKLLDDVHWAQCINYLKATGFRICLLINFGVQRVQIKRIASDDLSVCICVYLWFKVLMDVESMTNYGVIQEDFYTERTRILDALQQPENRHIILRLIGALAFRTHCPQFGYLQDALGRVFTDIDFGSYPRFGGDITRLLTGLGYEEDKMVTRLFGEGRMLFHDPAFGRHIDIFFNKLDFCHEVSFVGRLEVETLTLPLAELLLEKMQIVKLNEKDLIDTIMLLREHPVGEGDNETVNGKLIARLLGNDWGYWRTVTANLKLVDEMLVRYPSLTEEDRRVVGGRIADLLARIEAQPKTVRWNLRSRVGERVKWYKDVEELMGR